MILERFEVPGLAHYSYLLGSQGQAVVIDPKRDVDTYVDYARARDLVISHVLETHIHADYVSGTRELVAATGAELWVSGHDEGQEYRYHYGDRRLRDGDELVIGDLRLIALHTQAIPPNTSAFSHSNRAAADSLWRYSVETSYLSAHWVAPICSAKSPSGNSLRLSIKVFTRKLLTCRMASKFTLRMGPVHSVERECPSVRNRLLATNGSAMSSWRVTTSHNLSIAFSRLFPSSPTTTAA